ncbi:MAG: DUF4099 domain-containing protein [Muribaculaceae bacterium]
MKEFMFEEDEIPFGTLARFGLTRDMIEDLPTQELQRIYNGKVSSVLPIHVADDAGNIIKSHTRFKFVHQPGGDVDVVFFPVLNKADLSQFSEDEHARLLDGEAIVTEMDLDENGGETLSFVQIDRDTNQLMAVPVSVLSRNFSYVTDSLHLASSETNILQSGMPLPVMADDEFVTIGVDLSRTIGLRISKGDINAWRSDTKRDWEKYNFGINGCWVSDGNNGLVYIPEEKYDDEMWAEMSKRNSLQTQSSRIAR